MINRILNELTKFININKYVSRFRLRTDHNEDKTLDILYVWLIKHSNKYHNVDFEYENNTRRASETSQTHWTDERYLDVIRMKEEALNYGRKIWADYVLVSMIPNML